GGWRSTGRGAAGRACRASGPPFWRGNSTSAVGRLFPSCNAARTMIRLQHPRSCRPMSTIADAVAPAGRLRVAVWTVPYFAVENGGVLAGIVPDLGAEFARRIGVPAAFLRCATPGALIEAFRSGAADVTFVGVTAGRAEAIDFGPVLLDIATSYLVPASSPIARIADVDCAGVRILVPAASAQEAHLRKALAHATLIPVP